MRPKTTTTVKPSTTATAATTLTPLQQTWTTLYRTTLPTLAHSRSDWPVKLDHCFARIILDNAIGIDTPWAEKVKAPATRHMSEEQLKRAIDLGESIVRGGVDLGELDRRSLGLRGKVKGRGGVVAGSVEGTPAKAEKLKESPSRKRKAEGLGDTDIWRRWRIKDGDTEHKDTDAKTSLPISDTTSATAAEEDIKEQEATEAPLTNTIPISESNTKPKHTLTTTDDEAALLSIRARIASDKSLTPFRAHVLTLLTQVPRGRHTTYKALADAVPLTQPPRPTKSPSHPVSSSTSSQKPAATCARAVGSAMRNNPFAPTVPCHRVLAADGSIGGFGGTWGDGKLVEEKRALLRREGVGFDGRGRVVGEVFRGFV